MEFRERTQSYFLPAQTEKKLLALMGLRAKERPIFGHNIGEFLGQWSSAVLFIIKNFNIYRDLQVFYW